MGLGNNVPNIKDMADEYATGTDCNSSDSVSAFEAGFAAALKLAAELVRESTRKSQYPTLWLTTSAISMAEDIEAIGSEDPGVRLLRES
jgi:hypothetical protein